MLAIDRLFLGYMAAAGALALVAGGRVGAFLALTHALAGAAVWWIARRSLPRPPLLRFLRVAYPVALTPLLYAELATLNQFIVEGYFDELVQGWEASVFQIQLSLEASRWLPIFELSELLHLGYVSYYMIVPAALIGVFLARGAGSAHRTAFAVALAFFASYAIFAVFPVAGPRYYYEPIGGELAEGSLYRVVHAILEAGSSKGTAFPSSHIAASAAAVLGAGREDRRLLWWLAVPLAGLAIGTVYGRFHYGVDAVAGIALGLAAWAVTPGLMTRLAHADRGH